MQEAIDSVERPPTEWEKRFANDVANETLIFKIHKEIYKQTSTTTTTNNPIKTRAEDLNG